MDEKQSREVIVEAQEMLSATMEGVEHLKRSIAEGQSPETIRNIAKLLNLNFESLIRLKMIDLQDETFIKTVKEFNSLVARYGRMG